MKNRLKYCIAALAALFVHSLAAGPVPAAATRLQAIAADQDGEERLYIVQLAAPPCRYRASPAVGAEVTSPSPGDKLAAVQRYTDRLVARHDATLEGIGARHAKLYSYRYALNGFSARLTPHRLRSQGTEGRA
jgi:hypothetical protein